MNIWLLALAWIAMSAPVAAADGELHTFHCMLACPSGASETNDVVVREIYTLSTNDLTKMADWVAYRVTPASIGSSEGRDWQTDRWLSPDETLTPRSYDGASAALHIDRGHQAPLASFSATPFASDTNILSNITPQSSALNQGPWVRLENMERELAIRLNVAVYVLTGPLFERLMKPLPKVTVLHRVPSGYWKVVSLEDGRSTAFIFDQSADRRQDFCTARVTLDEVQLRSRLVLFPMTTKVSRSALDREIGCDAPAPLMSEPSEIPEESPGRPPG